MKCYESCKIKHFLNLVFPSCLHTDSCEGLLHLNISGVHFLALSSSGKVSWHYSDCGIFHGVERKV